MSHKLKFKVGDRVRLVGMRFPHHTLSRAVIGNEYVIDGCEKETRTGDEPKDWQEYRLATPSDGWWVCEEDLEIVESSESDRGQEKSTLDLAIQDIREAHNTGLSVLLVAVVEQKDGESANNIVLAKMSNRSMTHFIREATGMIYDIARESLKP